MYILKYDLLNKSRWQEGSITGMFFFLLFLKSSVLTTYHLFFFFNLILLAVSHSHLFYFVLTFYMFIFSFGENLCCSSANKIHEAHIFGNIPLSFL